MLGLLRERRFTVWLVTAEPDPALVPARSAVPDHLWGFACRRLTPPPRHRVAAIGKRTLDVCAAVLGLVAVALLLAACALAVRCSDGPGVLFRQERVGRNGRPFVVLKFRTLRSDAFESATRWSVADDRRMSTVGRWLRRISLDELPQLWNVLRGDMSLVGPRPERPYFVREFSQRYPTPPTGPGTGCPWASPASPRCMGCAGTPSSRTGCASTTTARADPETWPAPRHHAEPPPPARAQVARARRPRAIPPGAGSRHRAPPGYDRRAAGAPQVGSQTWASGGSVRLEWR